MRKQSIDQFDCSGEGKDHFDDRSGVVRVHSSTDLAEFLLRGKTSSDQSDSKRSRWSRFGFNKEFSYTLQRWIRPAQSDVGRRSIDRRRFPLAYFENRSFFQTSLESSLWPWTTNWMVDDMALYFQMIFHEPNEVDSIGHNPPSQRPWTEFDSAIRSMFFSAWILPRWRIGAKRRKRNRQSMVFITRREWSQNEHLNERKEQSLIWTRVRWTNAPTYLLSIRMLLCYC